MKFDNFIGKKLFNPNIFKKIAIDVNLFVFLAKI